MPTKIKPRPARSSFAVKPRPLQTSATEPRIRGIKKIAVPATLVDKDDEKPRYLPAPKPGVPIDEIAYAKSQWLLQTNISEANQHNIDVRLYVTIVECCGHWMRRVKEILGHTPDTLPWYHVAKFRDYLTACGVAPRTKLRWGVNQFTV